MIVILCSVGNASVSVWSSSPWWIKRDSLCLTFGLDTRWPQHYTREKRGRHTTLHKLYLIVVMVTNNDRVSLVAEHRIGARMAVVVDNGHF
jgi:hypothetical protein